MHFLLRMVFFYIFMIQMIYFENFLANLGSFKLEKTNIKT